MPSYLNFDSTKSERDKLLSRNLKNTSGGPQSFTASSYSVASQNDYSVLDLPPVDSNRPNDLSQPTNLNIFKPDNFSIFETLDTSIRRANLELYPYFSTNLNHTFISLFTNTNNSGESELLKFASNHMRSSDGPILSRIRQNLITVTDGRMRISEALSGDISTISDIVTGKQPFILPNYKITVAKTLPGKVIDFVQTIAGVTFPFSEIPGNYLSDPENPTPNFRPQAKTEIGKLWQDVTGALGSLLGIQRRPKLSRKPSDLLIEYMGEGQKQTLYRNLSFSKYAPDYTTSARSQNSSKIFKFADNFAEGVKNILGLEAPRGVAYIGDDRGEDVQFAMSDFNGRPVRSSYYLSLMFDPVAAELFHRDTNINEGGPISGNLTWISTNSQNKLGLDNMEYGEESSNLEKSLSTKYGFREDSILGETQKILNSLPSDGSGLSHVANVIDQTSRAFKDGDILMSRGSAVKYVDKVTGEESGAEFCRVWTKDRPYFNYSDTMKRTANIRKFDDSVMGGSSRPWNINMGPMSNGTKGFEGSTNIFDKYKFGQDYNGKSFYAKKYMFSLENLAWKTSTRKGFTVLDLPYCERGPNGGRVMWFPPYDLKVSEQNSAKWEENTFLGRPEPIYTYNNTSRSGQISFKVVVDHPSILNLLVREHFKDKSDKEADDYINAFFAGCVDVDFYDLIRRYTTLDPDDVNLIIKFLNGGKNPDEIQKYKSVFTPPTKGSSYTPPIDPKAETIKLDINLKFLNDTPEVTKKKDFISSQSYKNFYDDVINHSGDTVTKLTSELNKLLDPTNTTYNKTKYDKDRKLLYNSAKPTGDITENVNKKVTELTTIISNAVTGFTDFNTKLETLKNDIKEKTCGDVTINILSSCSAAADNKYNFKLSIRRSHAIIQDILSKVANDGAKYNSRDWWSFADLPTDASKEKYEIKKEFSYKDDLGFEREGKLIIVSKNAGEEVINESNQNCHKEEFASEALKRHSPVAFGCRQSYVRMEYQRTPKKEEGLKDDKTVPGDGKIPPSKLVPGDKEQIPSDYKKPTIDVMKRIIMKALSECYYFKTVEENTPLVFKSLVEKLKYFHPGFHSTTPEGLNARLTFLQQCVRPGDTIPIKGISDESDLNARNTTFGPPPICVLRVGDFYHSKIVIRDVNITFEDSTWDLNPEGIGVQPMIANVSLQVNFIGGQGLKEPISRLQNALSSNFYANTEMYDERSESTNETIGGVDAEKFTATFLKDVLNDYNNGKKNELPDDINGKNIKEGSYIGEYVKTDSTSTIEYKTLITNIFDKVKDYFETYQKTYNIIVKEYGTKIASIYFSPNYRSIKDLTIQTSESNTENVELLGVYPSGKEIEVLMRGFKAALDSKIETSDFVSILNFNSILPNSIEANANKLLKKKFKEILIGGDNSLVGKMLNNSSIKTLENSRNEIIKLIDKANYIVKYREDGTISGTTASSVLFGLPGITSGADFYGKYSDVISYIKKNHKDFTEDLDLSINFNSSSISDVDFQEVLSIVMKDPILIGDVMDVFGTQVDTSKMEKKLKKFATQPQEKKFKAHKDAKAKTSLQEVIYDVQTTDTITDTTKKSELEKIFKNKNKVGSTLNYYKP
jgi:hypothetical protein